MESKQLEMNKDSISYYENHADEFVESTINADMTGLYYEFEKYLTPGCKVLDLGCGSGRDSRYFSEKGYEVVAVDPSPAMCEKTKRIANVPVYQLKAEELDFENEFDAVWACASILHVPEVKQVEALEAVARSLKSKGIVYCSWKYGVGEHEDNDRYFTDMEEKTIYKLVAQIPKLKIINLWISTDVRSEKKSQNWINVLLMKYSVKEETSL